jgi:hypothetical protein
MTLSGYKEIASQYDWHENKNKYPGVKQHIYKEKGFMACCAKTPTLEMRLYQVTQFEVLSQSDSGVQMNKSSINAT